MPADRDPTARAQVAAYLVAIDAIVDAAPPYQPSHPLPPFRTWRGRIIANEVDTLIPMDGEVPWR